VRRERFFAKPLHAVWVGVQTPFLKDVALISDALGHGLGRALSLAAIAGVLLAQRATAPRRPA
jgi:hypothetical protein